MKLTFDKPLLMGILNVTPDSFSDGQEDGVYEPRLRGLLEQGADIIDIGAESTFGPDSQVSAEEEWTRLKPILSEIFDKQPGKEAPRLVPTSDVVCSAPFISIDTWKAEIAEKALEMGAQMINDVTALRGDPKMIDVLMKYKPYICLMFSADETPYASRTNYQYQDIIKTISEFLLKQAQILLEKGFPKEKIILDPGLGFFVSSDPKVSWEIIDRLGELKKLGFPVLVGHSMKSFLGGPIEERLPKTLGAAEMCLDHGADILRVHHVTEHKALL
ncbi:MAG: dihydropteroate synthase [Candidatus Gracilibacteria bacterium]|nr:dihydropteroate synthase [Candidatus Gracilibacteria bacterium]